MATSWNTVYPDGTKSVQDNKPLGQANTTYIKTTMNTDHYWDDSSNTDGHHKWVQVTQSGTSVAPVIPALSTGMDAIIYGKTQTSLVTPTNSQDVQLFMKNNKAVDTPGVTQEMQLIAMRACCVWTQSGSTVTVTYSHNVASVVRTGEGLYTVTFTDALPSVNYLVQGGGVRTGQSGSHVTNMAIRADGGSLADVKSTAKMELSASISGSGSTGSIARDVVQGWVYCFGG